MPGELLAPVLAEPTANRPNLGVRVRAFGFIEILERVREASVDVAFIYLPHSLRASGGGSRCASALGATRRRDGTLAVDRRPSARGRQHTVLAGWDTDKTCWLTDRSQRVTLAVHSVAADNKEPFAWAPSID